MFTLWGKTKIELLKKGVPGPIIISLKNQPTKILPKPKITKGNDIFQGASSYKPLESLPTFGRAE